jgi:hypothetical protein
MSPHWNRFAEKVAGFGVPRFRPPAITYTVSPVLPLTRLPEGGENSGQGAPESWLPVGMGLSRESCIVYTASQP